MIGPPGLVSGRAVKTDSTQIRRHVKKAAAKTGSEFCERSAAVDGAKVFMPSG
jgi:hypothetical protein